MAQRDAYESRTAKDICRLLTAIGAAAPVNLSALAAAAGLTTNKTFRLMTTLTRCGVTEKRGDGYYFGHSMAKIYAGYVHRLHQTNRESGQKLAELGEQ